MVMVTRPKGGRAQKEGDGVRCGEFSIQFNLIATKTRRGPRLFVRFFCVPMLLLLSPGWKMSAVVLDHIRRLQDESPRSLDLSTEHHGRFRAGLLRALNDALRAYVCLTGQVSL